MTKEEQDLLLKDLAARLPYKSLKCKLDLEGYLNWNLDYKEKFNKAVKIRPNLFKRISNEVYTLYGLPCWDRVILLEFEGDKDFAIPVRYIKPYLRPMSSMTKEEEKEAEEHGVICYNKFEGCSTLFDEEGLDWLNSHHFDYRGLIEKGLALEAPDGMYVTI